jgi:hypothetical protein
VTRSIAACRHRQRRSRRALLSGENPVGVDQCRRRRGEIVGRVGDIRRASLTDAPRADLYLPFER